MATWKTVDDVSLLKAVIQFAWSEHYITDSEADALESKYLED